MEDTKVIPLKSYFERRGLERYDSKTPRGVIKYTMLHHESGVGFIYQVEYEQIHYLVFKERFYISKNIMGYCYPSEKDFMDGSAVNFNNLQDATELLNEWIEEYKNN